MRDLFDNPMGLQGFEFVEFASPNPDELHELFTKLGFSHIANHRSKDVAFCSMAQLKADNPAYCYRYFLKP